MDDSPDGTLALASELPVVGGEGTLLNSVEVVDETNSKASRPVLVSDLVKFFLLGVSDASIGPCVLLLNLVFPKRGEMREAPVGKSALEANVAFLVLIDGGVGLEGRQPV